MQKVKGPPAEIVGAVGNPSTVTTVGKDAELWHPPALVTCTVKLPDVVTLILWVVAPVDHK